MLIQNSLYFIVDLYRPVAVVDNCTAYLGVILVHPPRVAESGRHFRYVTSPLPRKFRFYK